MYNGFSTKLIRTKHNLLAIKPTSTLTGTLVQKSTQGSPKLEEIYQNGFFEMKTRPKLHSAVKT